MATYGIYLSWNSARCSSLLRIGAIFLGLASFHSAAVAQTKVDKGAETAAGDRGLICISRKSASSSEAQGEERIKIPAAKLKKLEAAGFKVESCTSSGKPFVVAGVTLCQMAAQNDAAFNAQFLETHKVPLETVCRYAEPD